MQTILTEATAAYSPAGISDLVFIPNLTTAAAITCDPTSRAQAEFASEHLEMGISMSPARDDDDVADEGDDDIDEDDDEDDLDEDDDDLDDEEEDLDDDDDELDEEEDDDLDEDVDEEEES